jgi:hypothetical protein
MCQSIIASEIFVPFHSYGSVLLFAMQKAEVGFITRTAMDTLHTPGARKKQLDPSGSRVFSEV